MTITFENGFLSTLILDAKAIFTSFVPYIAFLIAVVLAFHILHALFSLLVGGRRRRVL